MVVVSVVNLIVIKTIPLNKSLNLLVEVSTTHRMPPLGGGWGVGGWVGVCVCVGGGVGVLGDYKAGKSRTTTLTVPLL